ncbi:HEPN domain-containing protein [bacterium]|nr:HEPN domain-containing protein [bacterium]MBU1752740.1 HEPN domain-containing protein [bacterium]
MDDKKVTQYWLATADDDWKVAGHLFEKGDYTYALFFGHLYLEKLLKALIVQNTKLPAPISHSLLYLSQKTSLFLSSDQETLMDRITGYNLAARYPDQQFRFKKTCTQEFCLRELDHIEGVAQWLKKEIKQ